MFNGQWSTVNLPYPPILTFQTFFGTKLAENLQTAGCVLYLCTVRYDKQPSGGLYLSTDKLTNITNSKTYRIMASERIALGINLRMNKNDKSAATYGKYYPEVDVQKTLSLRGFAQHMVNHGSKWNRGDLESMLFQVTECLPELLAQGVPVQLGNLGTFYPTAQVKKGAGVASISDMDGLDPNDIVQGIRIRFLPDCTDLDNLCGPAFKKACALELRNIVDTQSVTIDGKVKKLQTLKPIATAVAELRATGVIPSNPSTGGSTGGSTGDNTGGGSNGGDGEGGDLNI